MISELNIQNYRGIRNLELKNLGNINIIAGDNNIGKTSILEVIKSFENPTDLRSWRTISGHGTNRFPGPSISNFDLIKSLFPVDKDAFGYPIKYSGVCDGKMFEVEIKKEQYKTEISNEELDRISGGNGFPEALKSDSSLYTTEAMDLEFKYNGHTEEKNTIYSRRVSFPMLRKRGPQIVDEVIFISSTEYAKGIVYLNAILENTQRYEDFLKVMKKYDPDFITVNAVEDEYSRSRKYMVLSQNHSEGLPLIAYGDGMKKAMLLLSAVVRAKGKVLLLDEFGTAIHYSEMKHIFYWLIRTAIELDVQIFMTSHSKEAILAAIESCPEYQEKMRMITLGKTKSGVKARIVDGKKAIQLSEKYELELR